jgi:hypothetical protein
VRRRVETASKTASVGPQMGRMGRTGGRVAAPVPEPVWTPPRPYAAAVRRHRQGTVRERQPAAARIPVQPPRTDRAIAATVAHRPAGPAAVSHRHWDRADQLLVVGMVLFVMALLAGGVVLTLLVP